MKKALFLFLAFSFLFIPFAFAEISLRCEVDKNKITTGEQLVYKLIVSSSEKKFSAPKLPAFKGFSILSQAQSSTVVFVKGGLKTMLAYTYILTAQEPGKFKIEPSTITVKDKTYACQEVEIEVVRASPSSRQPEEKLPPLPKTGPPESEGPQITL